MRISLTFSKKIFSPLIFLFLFFSLTSVLALEVDYPVVPGAQAPTDEKSPDALPQYVNYIYKFGIYIVGLVFFISLVVAGVQYLISSGSPGKILEAKQRMSAAFFGLMILLCSYLLLYTINPSLIKLDFPKLKTAESEKLPEIEKAPSQEYKSLIQSELPLGKIIEERIFDSKKAREDKKKREEVDQDEAYKKGTARMERLLEISENFLALSDKLENQSKELKNLSEKCSCSSTQPCCEADLSKSSSPSESCPNNLCVSKPGCTCDPCKNQRDDIQDLEKKNFEAIYLGAEIKIKDDKGNETSRRTSIREEQKKASNEIMLIKNEIDKLERARDFMNRCPLGALENLASYERTKSNLAQKGWIGMASNYYKNIMVYHDWGTLYCPVSGTIYEDNDTNKQSSKKNTLTNSLGEKGVIRDDIDTIEDITNDTIEDIPIGNSGKPMACTIEIPIGEIINRSENLANKIGERLNKLISLSEELSKAVDDLHVLISQCSSRGPSADPQRGGCFSICQKTAFGACIKSCAGTPCPTLQIEKKMKEITDIVKGTPNDDSKEDTKKQKEGIKDAVEGKKKTKKELKEDPQAREQIGLKIIIKEIVPALIDDLYQSMRIPMQKCASSDATGAKNASDCKNSIPGVAPGGKLISQCCQNEDWFVKCLSQCYQEKGAKDYTKCLTDCQKDEAKRTNTPEKAYCFHAENFYCCNVE